MAKEMDMKMWHKRKSWMWLILGLLVLVNSFWAVVSWDYFVGIVLVLGGLACMMK